MVQTTTGGYSYSPSDDARSLPHEQTEIRVKTLFFRYLKENVPFEGQQDLVNDKILELTLGLYEIWLSSR